MKKVFWSLLLVLVLGFQAERVLVLAQEQDPILNITSITGWEGPVGAIESVKRVTKVSCFNRLLDRIAEVQTAHFGPGGELRLLSLAFGDGGVGEGQRSFFSVPKSSYLSFEFFEDNNPVTIGKVELRVPSGVEAQVTYEARKLIQGGEEEVIETISVPAGTLPSSSGRFQAVVGRGADTGFRILNPNPERTAVRLELYSLFSPGAVNDGYGLDPISTVDAVLGPGEIFSRFSLAEVFSPPPIIQQGGITLPPGPLVVTDGSVKVTASFPIFGTASRVDSGPSGRIVTAVPVY